MSDPIDKPTSTTGAQISEDAEHGTKNTNNPSTIDSNTPSRKLPRAKLSAVDRFKKLGSTLKLKQSLQSANRPKFPPASWNLAETIPALTVTSHGGTTSANTSQSNVGQTTADIASISASINSVPEQTLSPNTGYTQAIISNGRTDSEMTTGVNADVVAGRRLQDEQSEPITLARKIQNLLYTLPGPTSASTTDIDREQDGTPSTSATPSSIPSAPPPPQGFSLLSDPRLTALLCSTSIMNGSISKGRESVWTALSRLRPQPQQKPIPHPEPGPLSSSLGQVPSGPTDESADVNDSDSVMFYAPLEPDDMSEVELARSEVKNRDGTGECLPEIPLPSPGPDSTAGASQAQKFAWWPFSKNGRVETQTSYNKGKEKESDNEPERIWVPSRTKISLEATWWGYRIYLPPPVLRILGNVHLESAKRAALLTTALKWLFDHIPLAMFPPQIRAVISLSRRLVPLLGYVGSFVAWSWSAIKSFDRGNGVILSATWLLPVALVPSSWDVDVPIPPTPPTASQPQTPPPVPPKK